MDDTMGITMNPMVISMDPMEYTMNISMNQWIF